MTVMNVYGNVYMYLPVNWNVRIWFWGAYSFYFFNFVQNFVAEGFIKDSLYFSMVLRLSIYFLVHNEYTHEI